MKKAWRTLAACLAVYVLSFGLSAAVMSGGSAEKEAQTAGTSPAVMTAGETDTVYIVKEHNGVVAVFPGSGDKPAIETDIIVNSLRASDREMLEKGITMGSYTEVLCLLEDLNS